MKNLILLKNDGTINSLIVNFDGNLENGIFNSELTYKQVNDDLFIDLCKKFGDYIIKLNTQNVEDMKLTINDFTFTVAPPKPPVPPTKEELLSKAILETTIEQNKLKAQATALGQATFERAIQETTLQKQVKALSSAVFQLITKNK